jgi:PAS domain S-box-containing protein
MIEKIGMLLVEDNGAKRAIKKAEERDARHARPLQLRGSEKLYRSLFDNNLDSIWVYDTETLRFLAVNNTAVSCYGFSRERFLAMKLTDVFRNIFFDLSDETPMRAEHRTEKGELIKVQITSRKIRFEGKSARVVVVTAV